MNQVYNQGQKERTRQPIMHVTLRSPLVHILDFPMEGIVRSGSSSQTQPRRNTIPSQGRSEVRRNTDSLFKGMPIDPTSLSLIILYPSTMGH